MITQKFNYAALKRKNINGKRHYLLEGHGEYSPMASVTTILSATKPEADRLALENWKKNVGHQRAQAITTEASSRGTRLHSYLENFCITDELSVPGTNPYAKQANKMAGIVIAEGMKNVNEIWGVEVPVCHPNIYAGVTDCVGVHNGDEAIIDFKQTNKPKKVEWIKGYFLQLCAYAEAHNILHGTNIRTGVIMMCSKDYDYQEFVIKDDEFDHYRRIWWHRVEEYFEL